MQNSNTSSIRRPTYLVLSNHLQQFYVDAITYSSPFY